MNIDYMQSISGEWVRPSDWPDMLSIPIDYANNEEVIYLLYDNRLTTRSADLRWAGFGYSYSNVASSGRGINIEIGTVQNSSFAPISSFMITVTKGTGTNNVNYAYVNYDSINNDYIVFKITPVNIHLLRFMFADINTSDGAPAFICAMDNLCVEKFGYLPYATRIDSSGYDINASNSYRNCLFEK